MKSRLLVISIFPVLFLAACTPANPPAGDTGNQPSMNDQEDAGEAMMKKDQGVMIEAEGEAMMKKDEGAMMKEDSSPEEKAMMSAGVYKDNTASNLPASVLTDGQTKVLYFFAAWCPTCKKANQTLTSWYADGKGMLTVYKINYDEEKILEQKYGVTYQHTFVKVDGQGKMIEKIQGPSDDDLKRLLQS